MAGEINMTPRDSWLLSVLARLPKDRRRTDKDRMEEYITQLSSDALKDVGRVLLGELKPDEVDPALQEIVNALKEWATRNVVAAV